MRWQKLKLKDGTNAPNTIVSDRGFRILRCTDNGVPTGRYVAFYMAANETRIVLGGFSSSDDAKLACTAYDQQTRGVAA